MRLKSSNGIEFSLKIQGYDHPNAEHPDFVVKNRYDDWLIIEIRAKHQAGEWRAHDPCLLTWEVDDLISWLTKAAKANSAKLYKSFLEPNISFEVVSSNADFLTVQINF